MSRTILLADDSITIQKVVELTFLESDYKVVSFDNGDDALAQIDSLAPDLVIADVHMPGASGYEVARRVKQGAPQTPVLLLVGTFEPFDEPDVAASGADAFLMKPFDSQELLSRVDELSVSSAPENATVDTGVEAASGVSSGSEEALSEAPTAVVAEPDAPREVSAAAEPASGSSFRLSDEDIDRIARRVVAELTPEMVREVAREIVPEVAEIVAKERIRQLDQEVE